MSRSLALLPALLLAGCAFEPGGPFATVEPSLEARYAELPGRDAGERFQRLSSDYQVKLTRAELRLDAVGLLQGAGGAASFDPASPPPGYGLCHGGHCHRDDGALVSYEEIEAELAGGAAGLTTALVLPVGERDLLAGGRGALSCEPACELGLGTVRRIEAHASRLVLEGVVRDGRAEARIAETRFRLEAALAPSAEGVIGAAIELPIDRDSPPGIRLALTLELTARLFDEVDWAALQALEAGIDLTATENPRAFSSIVAGLGEAELRAAVERFEK